MVIGDLNEISSSEDKIGGSSPSLDRFKTLEKYNNLVGTMDLPFTDNRFTWRKVKDGPNNILERLDRTLVSNLWFTCFLAEPNTLISQSPTIALLS